MTVGQPTPPNLPPKPPEPTSEQPGVPAVPPTRPVVAVVGAGYVGTCVIALLADLALEVLAVEADPEVARTLAAGRSPVPEPGVDDILLAATVAGRLQVVEPDQLGRADVIIVAVGTPLDAENRPDLGQLDLAATDLARFVRAGQLICVKSTTAPGTVESLVAGRIEATGLSVGSDIFVAACPERLAEGNALRDLRSVPVLVGGVEPRSTTVAATFWHEVVGLQVLTTTSAATAEMAKLADNLWIDVNIALAQEIARVCDLVDVDVMEVRRAANSLPKADGQVHMLLPSVGVGGACLTKDPWFVDGFAHDAGLQLELPATARRVNDAAPDYAFDRLVEGLDELGIALAGARITVLGLAFNNNTGDTRHTPVRPLVHRLIDGGADVVVCDPLVKQDELPLERDLTTAVAGADCVAVTASHSVFRNMSLPWLWSRVSDPCLLFDGRLYLEAERIDEARALGFAYRGIGR
jgi:UDP-N-acetyl-D-mannosaminuronic acid dehydrogenase